MKVLLQRVQRASLKAFSEDFSSSSPYESKIEQGLLVYVSVSKEDETLSDEKLISLVQKIVKGRFFSQDFTERLGIPISPSSSPSPERSHHLNLSLVDIAGSLLVVSQITLQGTLKKGTKPAFDKSAGATLAEDVYKRFCSICRDVLGREAVKTGVFGAHMETEVKLDGPVTFLLEIA